MECKDKMIHITYKPQEYMFVIINYYHFFIFFFTPIYAQKTMK